jgi:hypothetical protein
MKAAGPVSARITLISTVVACADTGRMVPAAIPTTMARATDDQRTRMCMD